MFTFTNIFQNWATSMGLWVATGSIAINNE